ncbi:IPT/TIG domain-containing protein [Streptomyces sp. NPDC059037]|uniref:IPT/TIG domain-containing protein n=1 Tax=Streptomyces sp. NPDC059037 TaxID=3346710 RepID=UPI0036BECE1A
MPELQSDPRPELMRFEPPSGPVDGGQQVTVHGNHLQYVIDIYFDIYFDHDACIIKEQQANKMVLITPAHSEGVAEGHQRGPVIAGPFFSRSPCAVVNEGRARLPSYSSRTYTPYEGGDREGHPSIHRTSRPSRPSVPARRARAQPPLVLAHPHP